MLKVENIEVYGWKQAIRGMRNPLNSWEQSDSYETVIEDPDTLETAPYSFVVGEKDLALMRKLAAGGPSHAKFRRMVNIAMDITAPLYWWKEFDTYKVGTVANSCSTMHTIHKRPLDISDFSCEHLTPMSEMALRNLISVINYYREEFVESKDKASWWQMIQLLPSSFNQKRTVVLNYEVAAKIYDERVNHKQDEWRQLCAVFNDLPYSELITGPFYTPYNDLADDLKQAVAIMNQSVQNSVISKEVENGK